MAAEESAAAGENSRKRPAEAMATASQPAAKRQAIEAAGGEGEKGSAARQSNFDSAASDYGSSWDEADAAELEQAPELPPLPKADAAESPTADSSRLDSGYASQPSSQNGPDRADAHSDYGSSIDLDDLADPGEQPDISDDDEGEELEVVTPMPARGVAQPVRPLRQQWAHMQEVIPPWAPQAVLSCIAFAGDEKTLQVGNKTLPRRLYEVRRPHLWRLPYLERLAHKLDLTGTVRLDLSCSDGVQSYRTADGRFSFPADQVFQRAQRHGSLGLSYGSSSIKEHFVRAPIYARKSPYREICPVLVEMARGEYMELWQYNSSQQENARRLVFTLSTDGLLVTSEDRETVFAASNLARRGLLFVFKDPARARQAGGTPRARESRDDGRRSSGLAD